MNLLEKLGFIKKKAQTEFPVEVTKANIKAVNQGSGWSILTSTDGTNYIPTGVSVSKEDSDYESAMEVYNNIAEDIGGEKFSKGEDFFNSVAYGSFVIDDYTKQYGGGGEPLEQAIKDTKELAFGDEEEEKEPEEMTEYEKPGESDEEKTMSDVMAKLPKEEEVEGLLREELDKHSNLENIFRKAKMRKESGKRIWIEKGEHSIELEYYPENDIWTVGESGDDELIDNLEVPTDEAITIIYSFVEDGYNVQTSQPFGFDESYPEEMKEYLEDINIENEEGLMSADISLKREKPIIKDRKKVETSGSGDSGEDGNGNGGNGEGLKKSYVYFVPTRDKDDAVDFMMDNKDSKYYKKYGDLSINLATRFVEEVEKYGLLFEGNDALYASEDFAIDYWGKYGKDEVQATQLEYEEYGQIDEEGLEKKDIEYLVKQLENLKSEYFRYVALIDGTKREINIIENELKESGVELPIESIEEGLCGENGDGNGDGGNGEGLSRRKFRSPEELEEYYFGAINAIAESLMSVDDKSASIRVLLEQMEEDRENLGSQSKRTFEREEGLKRKGSTKIKCKDCGYRGKPSYYEDTKDLACPNCTSQNIEVLEEGLCGEKKKKKSNLKNIFRKSELKHIFKKAKFNWFNRQSWTDRGNYGSGEFEGKISKWYDKNKAVKHDVNPNAEDFLLEQSSASGFKNYGMKKRANHTPSELYDVYGAGEINLIFEDGRFVADKVKDQKALMALLPENIYSPTKQFLDEDEYEQALNIISNEGLTFAIKNIEENLEGGEKVGNTRNVVRLALKAKNRLKLLDKMAKDEDEKEEKTETKSDDDSKEKKDTKDDGGGKKDMIDEAIEIINAKGSYAEARGELEGLFGGDGKPEEKPDGEKEVPEELKGAEEKDEEGQAMAPAMGDPALEAELGGMAGGGGMTPTDLSPAATTPIQPQAAEQFGGPYGSRTNPFTGSKKSALDLIEEKMDEGLEKEIPVEIKPVEVEYEKVEEGLEPFDEEPKRTAKQARIPVAVELGIDKQGGAEGELAGLERTFMGTHPLSRNQRV